MKTKSGLLLLHTWQRCFLRSIVCLSPPLAFCSSSGNSQSPQKGGSWLRRLFSSDVSCNTCEDVAKYVKDKRLRKIIVMAGAGISTPSGIPDFRSPGTGLYHNLQKYNLPYAEAVFDLDYFRHDPQPFFTLAHELYPSGRYQPNLVHYFIRLLHDKGLLHRMYTQNIDGFERLAGIPAEKLVEAHGTFSTATCTVCREPYQGKDIEDSIFRGEIPVCKVNICQGIIKPDIVFFGEQLPARFWMFMADMPQCDLLIVMGTSLEVQPFAGIAEAVLPGTPRVLFNKEATGPFVDNPRRNDVIVEGDLLETIRTFCTLLGWQEELGDLLTKNEKQHQDDPS